MGGADDAGIEMLSVSYTVRRFEEGEVIWVISVRPLTLTECERYSERLGP